MTDITLAPPSMFSWLFTGSQSHAASYPTETPDLSDVDRARQQFVGDILWPCCGYCPTSDDVEAMSAFHPENF